VIEKIAVISEVCNALALDEASVAKSRLRRDYPFAPIAPTLRKYKEKESTGVFVHDGFLDRYTGERLIFPPVLRVLSIVLPDEFPYHPNWKTSVTHPAFWEVGATIDHVVPVSRGGADGVSNWVVTTSMARNSAKMNWTLEELGWSLEPPGNFAEWDGLLHWILEFTASHANLLRNPLVRRWHHAATLVINA